MNDKLYRYSRQIAFSSFGQVSQRKLMNSRALIIGVGGLGSWTAELLVRAGIGHLKLADDDRVDISNIHRQALYNQNDVMQNKLKVDSAAQNLLKINSDCAIEALSTRIDKYSIASAANEVDLIVDGTDNFETRYLINDYSVKNSLPWVFAGVLRSEGQVMAVIPGKTPCLRCIMPELPECKEQSCLREGVLGVSVAMIAALQAAEALKILTGNLEKINPYLVKYDLWNNQVQRLNISNSRREDCITCGQKDYEFIER